MLITRKSCLELGLNGNTFYKTLSRLQTKYGFSNNKSNNQFTVVSILGKSVLGNSGNSKSNIKVTTREQRQSNNIYNNINTHTEREKPHGSLSFLLNIPQEDLLTLKAGLVVTDSQVKDKAEDFYNYCLSKGRKYKDYRAALRNALKKDYPRNNAKSI